MSVHTFGWCRVEGAHVPHLGDKYGTFINMSPSQTVVFYGTPEISIYHPFDTVNGIVYKVVPVTEFGDFDTINKIDTSLPALVSGINSYDKRVTINDGCYYWYEPFTIDETSVIFYDSSDHDYFGQYSIIYVDKTATPNVIAITADYGGPSVPVGENFRVNDITIRMIYEDMQDALVEFGAWSIRGGSAVVENEGANIIEIVYITPDERELTATCIVTGIKNLVSIEASYDSAGPKLAASQKVDRKYITVIAHYTDGSSEFVSDYTLVNGATVTLQNNGILDVFYKGKVAQFAVPMYEINSARLIAYYNGPDVEIGYDWIATYVVVKIYYESDDGNGYSEDVDIYQCGYSTGTITTEGVNQITVTYDTDEFGRLSTVMSVTGISNVVTLDYITAEYRGPEIVIGFSFSYERLFVNAHYTDGSVTTVRNYTVPTNVVRNIGDNIYTVTYTERGITKQCDILVIGVAKEETTQYNLFNIMLDKHYPEMTSINHRFRGPAEATKMRHYSRFIYDMIREVNDIFASIEQEYKEYCGSIENLMLTKYDTLDSIKEITDSCNSWLTDKRFTSGEYIMETEE